MNYVYILFLFGFLMISCEQNTQEQEHLKAALSEQQMVDILIDIHSAESALSMKNYNRDSSLVLFQFYKEEIYKKRNTTEQQFQQSYGVYALNSEALDRIYAAVIDSLSVRESRALVK